MRALLKELARSPIVRPQRPATAAEIRRAERELGVTFPEVYKAFLRTCGVLNVYDGTVFGLGPYTHRRDRDTASTIFQTRYHREWFGLPAYLIVVWHDCHMDCTCLDTRRTQRGDCPVVFYDPKAARRKVTLAPTFSAWLKDVVEKQTRTKQMLDAEMPGKLTAMGEPRRRRRKKKAKSKR
jgi:hypothetical protein